MKIYLLSTIFITSFLILFSSCSNSPKKDVQEKENSTNLLQNPSNIVENKTITPEKPISPIYVDLFRSIEIQNDELIKSASIEILKENPKDIYALNSLAMFYYKKNQNDAASSLLNRALVVNPNSMAVLNNLGLVILTKKDRRESANYFRKCLDIDATYIKCAVNIATIYAQDKDFQKIFFVLDPILKNSDLEKQDTDALALYALALSFQNKTIEAKKIYDLILQKNPNHIMVLHNYSFLAVDKLNEYNHGLDLINRLKFVARDFEGNSNIKELEIRAKAGLK